jgi:hypothetical protein
MSGLLGSVYSFGDSLKRKVRGLLSDPLAQIQLNMNQAAGGFNDAMRSPATDYARAGGVMADDPSTQAAIRAEADRRIGALMNVMPGGLLGATVWHGSPHKFAKFDASKIGTGEGAQAYGHGLYLAENPSVAKSYQFIDAQIDPNVVKYGGRRLETLYTNAQRAQDMAHRMPNGPAKNAAIAKANAELDLWERMMTRNHPKQVIDDALDPSLGWPEQEDFAKSLRLDKFSGVDMNPGNFYTVDLPDPMIARMLDWDKPLSQQVPEVRAALEQIPLRDRGVNVSDKNSVSDLLNGLVRGKFNNPANLARGVEASRRLGQSGIPGIRYLDSGSRGAGSGTSNFVVFPGEEGLLTILERNGVSLR